MTASGPLHPGTDVTLFLCGDVMLGRGIDQISRHPSKKDLHEPVVESAEDYVALAEHVNGPIPRHTGYEYVWGEALEQLERVQPAARIVNLETAVTRCDAWIEKGINYRMHPANVGWLTAAHIDCCVLANNHVLDYTRAGLEETLRTLHDAGVATAGAGHDLGEACAPAIVPIGEGGRAIVFGLASVSSGTPVGWAAKKAKAGLNVIEATSDAVEDVARRAERLRKPGDIVVASVHWGNNWGHSIPRWEQDLARSLIDRAGVDVVHGHSSHHPKAMEIYRDRLILYGCGDFLNDYEGISGYDEFRGDLALMYFPHFDRATGALLSLRMTPLCIRGFRLNRAAIEDARWLKDTLDGVSGEVGCRVELEPDGTLVAHAA